MELNDPVGHKIFTKDVSEFALSPNEKQIAFVVRGKLFIKPNDKEMKRAGQLTDHAYRDKEPVWVNDSTLIFVSDRSGNFDLYALHSNGNEGDLTVSKDGQTFYFTTNGGGRQGSPGPSDLLSVKWDGTEIETLVKKINVNNVVLDEDGQSLYGIKSGGSIVKINIDRKDEICKKLPFRRAASTIASADFW